MVKNNYAGNCNKIFLYILIIVFSILFIPNVLSTTFQMEWDKQSVSPETWTQINLRNTYNNPIVVAGPEYSSTTNANGIGVWVTNVTTDSFMVRTSDENFAASDTINIHYIVMEEGNWTLPNSSIKVEAGKLSSNKVGVEASSWSCPTYGDVINFTNSFDSNPLVMSVRGSNNNPSAWAVTFQNDPSNSGNPVPTNQMCIGLSQSKAISPGTISNNETIYWIAADEGNGTLSNVEYEILWNLQDTGDSGGSWINGYGDSPPHTQSWTHTWTGAPNIIIAGMTSSSGTDGGWPVIYDTGNVGSIRMFVDEANDRSHSGSESGGGWAWNNSGAYGNEHPAIFNPKLNGTVIERNESILFNVTVEDIQGNNTVNEVVATFLYPDSSKHNITLNQCILDFNLTSSDLESSQIQKIATGAESVWFGGWNYRKEHIITGSTAGALENYTIKFNIYNKSGFNSENHVYLSNKVNSDFSDLRFTNSSGGSLDYWIEEYKSESVVVWVEMDYIPASPNNTTIFIYYGNSSATSESNGTNTFVLYEDFENYSSTSDGITPPIWNIFNNGNVTLATQSGNRVLLKTKDNDPNGGHIGFGTTISSFEAIFWTNRINGNGGSQNRYSIADSTGDGYGPRMYDFTGSSETFAIEERNGGSTVSNIGSTTFTANSNTWYKVLFRYYNDDMNFTLYDNSGNVISSVVATDTTYNSFDTFFVHGGYEFYTDNITIRRYVDPEPSHGGWSIEKTVGADNDSITPYTQYDDVLLGVADNVTSIKVKINVSVYDDSGSTVNSNNMPDLNLDFSTDDGFNWVNVGVFNITSTGEYVSIITNQTILDLWSDEDNRNLRINGIDFDYGGSTQIDEINWTDLFVEMNYTSKTSTWKVNFNDTNQTGFYNITDIYATDNGNLTNHSQYTNLSFRVNLNPEVILISPINNTKVLSNGTVQLIWDITDDSSTLNCTLYINEVFNQTNTCSSGTNNSLNLSINSGIYNWTINTVDPENNTANSTTENFSIILNKHIKITKKIVSINTDLYNIILKTENKINNSYSYNVVDFLNYRFNAGSYSTSLNWTNTTNGKYNGTVLGWNLTSIPLGNNQINYSITNNIVDYYLLDEYMVGLG